MTKYQIKIPSLVTLIAVFLATLGCRQNFDQLNLGDDTDHSDDTESSEITDGGIDAGINEDAGLDTDSENPGDAIFDPNHMLEISIDLNPSDWDLIRNQSRTITDTFVGDCRSAPFESPFTYVSSTVTVDKTTLQNVGIRKKAFWSSLSNTKPALKLKFDKYIEDQYLHGLERITLNNVIQDPSLLQTCLGYWVFNRAGLPAPRCNFAHVTVNNQDMGIYVNVEPIKKRFLRRHFDDDEGNLYEGTFSDFREGWNKTFEKKTNTEQPGGEDIIALTEVLSQATDDNLITAIEPLIDLDSFITYWATESLIKHSDGFTSNTNNFFVYNDPTTNQFHFIPWGVDHIMQMNANAQQMKFVYTHSLLANRLFLLPHAREMYIAKLKTLLEVVWDENALTNEIARMESIVRPYSGDSIDDGIDGLLLFITQQRQVLHMALEREQANPDNNLQPEVCIREIGTLVASFTTNFGTLEVSDPLTEGSGLIQATIEENTIGPTSASAVCGFEDTTENTVKTSLLTSFTDESVMIAKVTMPTDKFLSNMEIEMDGKNTSGHLYEFHLLTGSMRSLGVLNGTIILDKSSLNDGAEIEGRIESPILRR